MAALSNAVIDIEGLWTVFGKGASATTVHQDLNLRVEGGEMLSLVGGSGTGKTVLLRQILGLMQPTRGRVTSLGRPAVEMCGPGAASRGGCGTCTRCCRTGGYLARRGDEHPGKARRPQGQRHPDAGRVRQQKSRTAEKADLTPSV